MLRVLITIILSIFTTGVVDAAPPNVVVILVDDLRWDDLGCTGHPFVKTPQIDRLAAEGMSFSNAFAVTALCSPSRASLLTGQYPHTHGVVDNTDRSPLSHRLVTFPRVLHDAGYETGYVGKWHMGVDGSPRPGFDDWLSVKGQGSYFDPEFNDNGRVVKAKGYVTDLFTDRAIAFLRKPRTKPFCLYVSHKAVHPDVEQRADGSLDLTKAANFTPAPRHAQLYAGAVVPRRLNVMDPLDGKPALQREIAGLPPLGLATGTKDEEVLGRLRMLAAVEESTGQLLAALDEMNAAQNTIVVFTSDHGYFYGEHGLSVERRLAYEEAIRIPLLIRWPATVKPGVRESSHVLTVDLAPTLLAACGTNFPHVVEGRSFVPLLHGQPREPRTPFLIEHASDDVFPRTRGLGYDAVRTHRYKLIRYREPPGFEELYDLRTDPYERKNWAREPAAQATLHELEKTLEQLKKHP